MKFFPEILAGRLYGVLQWRQRDTLKRVPLPNNRRR